MNCPYRRKLFMISRTPSYYQRTKKTGKHVSYITSYRLNITTSGLIGAMAVAVVALYRWQ